MSSRRRILIATWDLGSYINSVCLSDFSRDDVGVAHTLERGGIAPHRVDGLFETDIPGAGQVVLPVKVEDGHDEVQEGPGEALHDPFLQIVLPG